MVSGGRPSVGWMVAPIPVSGSMTRRIGRRLSEASPVMTVRNGCAAARPASSRIVVPELAASTGPGARTGRAGRGR